MKFLFLVIAGLAASFHVLAFDASTWPRDKPLPSRPGTTGQLENGVRYAIEHRSYGDNEDKAYIAVLVQTGSLYEEKNQAGYAHFIEHVLFRGSRGQSARKTEKFFEKMGVSGNFHGQQGSTFLDRTTYSLPIPEEPDKNMPTAIKILAARVGAPLFKKKHVEAEREIVLVEELQRRMSEAQMRARKEYLGEDHELIIHLPIGTTDSLSLATRDGLRDFYEKWYRPDRMVVVVAGDVDPSSVEKAIARYFGKLKKPKSENPPIRRVVAPSGENLAFITDPKLEVRSMGLTLYRDRKPSYSMDEMKQRLIASLGTSVLRNRLSDYRNQKGYVTGLRASFSRRNMDFETDDFSLRVEDGYELQAFSEVIGIVNHTLYGGFTALEIETARQLAGKGFDRSAETEHRISNAGIANQWVAAMRYGYEPLTAGDIAVAGKFLLGEITAQEIHESLSDRFKAKRVALVLGVPEGEKYPSELKEFREVLTTLTGRELLKTESMVAASASEVKEDPFVVRGLTPGEITEVRVYDAIDTTHVTLSNNAQVLFKKNTQAETPLIINMRSPGGLSLIDDYDVVRSSMVRDVIQSSGLRGLKGSSIMNLYRFHRTSLSMSIGQTEHGLNLRTTPEDLEFGLRVLHIAFTEASVDEEIFETNVAKSRTGLTGMIESPRFKFSAEVGDVLTPGRKMNSSNIHPALLDNLTPVWIQETTNTLFSHVGGTYFIISGPVDWQDIEPLVLKYIGSLPGGKPRPFGSLDDYSIAGKSAEVRHSTNPDERSEGRMYFIEPSPGYDNRDDYIRSVYANLLGQRLFKEIREEEALVYSISARASSPRYPSPHAQVAISYVADPANIEEIERRVVRIMSEMTTDVRTSEIEIIQKMLTRGFNDALDRPNFMLGVAYDGLIQGKPIPTPADFLGHIESLSKEDISDYARKVAKDLVVVTTEFRPDTR